MKAYVFPGQGSQFPGMAKNLFQSFEKARRLFEEADDIMGFHIDDTMFEGTAQDLLSTRVTQPAVFLHSVIEALCVGENRPDMVAGHSLGEFSALVVAGVLEFADALKLVAVRASAMQKCCEKVPGTMAAVLACDEEIIRTTCEEVEGIVVPANFNCEGQIVISGESDAVNRACELLKERGAKRAIPLKVGGAFHSPLMEPARTELAEAIESTPFNKACCPVYQNVDAMPHTDPSEIKANLLMQLTSPVLWTQSVKNMVDAGADSFSEAGPGNVLQGLVRKIAPEAAVSHLGE